MEFSHYSIDVNFDTLMSNLHPFFRSVIIKLRTSCKWWSHNGNILFFQPPISMSPIHYTPNTATGWFRVRMQAIISELVRTKVQTCSFKALSLQCIRMPRALLDLLHYNSVIVTSSFSCGSFGSITISFRCYNGPELLLFNTLWFSNMH